MCFIMDLVDKFSHTHYAQLFVHEPSTRALRDLIDLTRRQSSDTFVRPLVSVQASEILPLKLYPFRLKPVMGEDWEPY